MKKILIVTTFALIAVLIVAVSVFYLKPEGTSQVKICEGYGPQTPRDITKAEGTNDVIFKVAPSYDNLNLCNIHFHKNAEHSGPEFNVLVGIEEFDGFECNTKSELSSKELESPNTTGCSNIQPGDTIEIHWVHSSCDIQPGKGLGSCLTDTCTEPDLRVQAQIFLLVNDPNAEQMQNYALKTKEVADQYHQAKNIPSTDASVEYLGSTTGPSYDADTKCSPLKVNWSVEPTCKKMDINSLHKWCQDNIFEESSAQGIRPLVTNPKLLSQIE